MDKFYKEVSEIVLKEVSKLQEKYGDEFPILLFEQDLESKKRKIFENLVRGNSSVHLFSELGEAVNFAHSLAISFIIILPSDFDEAKLIQEFKYVYERKMFGFEEEALLNDLFKESSDEIIKSFKVHMICKPWDFLSEIKKKDYEKEVMMMCETNEISKEFRQEFIVIWYDPNINSENKQKFEEQIGIRVQERDTFTEFADIQKIFKNYNGTPFHLIMSGGSDKVEEVLEKISKSKDLLGLYIYGSKFEDLKKIENDKVEIQNSIEDLVPRIKEGIRTRSKLKHTLPAFATDFDSSDRTGIYKLHYFLESLINFRDRKQAKDDFLRLARTIYQDEDKDLSRFEDKYNEYNKEEILRWYTKDSPINKLINNCLRISSSDSILYCRLILQDMRKAIREHYKEKSQIFNGVVYRGAYVLEEEWEKLEKNIGEEIEMYGFLSTSKSKKVALNFVKSDPQNKIFVKIIIPSLPELDEQGFADVTEFSQFPGEEEILFNVKSRFKILQAEVSKIDDRGTICKQLVLLYGAQVLRKHISKQKPLIEIKLDLPQDVKCHLCGSIEKLFGFKQERTVVSCMECLIKGDVPTDTPFIALEAKDDGTAIKTLQGIILTSSSKEGVKFANSGYKCHYCESKEKEKYYKWISCDGMCVFNQCSDCFEKKTAKHQIFISESSPYAMWQEQQKNWETVNSDYQKILPQQIEDTNQGHVELEVQNYDWCIEYAKKVIGLVKRQRAREIYKCKFFSLLGQAFLKLGNYQEARRYYSSCLNLARFISQEEGPYGAAYNCNLGSIHYHLGEYQKGLEFYEEALRIEMSLSGENSYDATIIYNGFSIIYSSLGEHDKVFEYLTRIIAIQKPILGENHPTLAIIYCNLATHYLHMEKYEEALKYITTAHHIDKSIYGKSHPSTASSYSRLALFYQQTGEYDKAQKYYLKAMKIEKITRGTSSLEIALSYNNLGSIYLRQGLNKEALESLNKAYDIERSLYGEKHPATANSLNKIGLVSQSNGDFHKAREYFQMALDLRKSMSGENHVEVAVSYNNMAVLFFEAFGDFKGALEYFEKVLNIQKRIFPESHPSIATSYQNLGGVWNALRDFKKSIEYSLKALPVLESASQERHPDLAILYNNIGTAYDNLGEHSKALEFMKKAIDVQLSIYGEKSPEIINSYNNLGKYYKKLGEFKKALDYLQKALDLQLSIFGEDHPYTLTIYDSLGGLNESLGNFQETLEFHKKALVKRIAIFGEMHPDTAVSYNSLASAYQNLRDFDKAIEHYRKALDIRKSILGEKHMDTGISENDLATVYLSVNKYKKAIKHFKKVLDIYKSILPENHPEIATTENNIGIAYLMLGHHQQALECNLKAIKIRESIFREKHPDTASSYDTIGSVYSKMREYKKALQYHNKALKMRLSIFGEEKNKSEIATSYSSLGSFYSDRRQYQMAKDNFQKALDILKPLYGDHHHQTAKIYENLFLVCSWARENEEAKKYLNILRCNKDYAYMNLLMK